MSEKSGPTTLNQLTLFAGASHAQHSAAQVKKEALNKTLSFMNLSEFVENCVRAGYLLKMSKVLKNGGKIPAARSKLLGMSGKMPSLIAVILEHLKVEDVTLQSVFKEECCLVHNIYGGFKEKKVRVFMTHSPTLRTPKGGGHLPSVLKKNGELSSLMPSAAETIMGFPIGWTELKD